jgi:hypothetical protein
MDNKDAPKPQQDRTVPVGTVNGGKAEAYPPATIRITERVDNLERNSKALEELVEVNKKGLGEERRWRWKNLALALIAIGVAVIGLIISIVH